VIKIGCRAYGQRTRNIHIKYFYAHEKENDGCHTIAIVLSYQGNGSRLIVKAITREFVLIVSECDDGIDNTQDGGSIQNTANKIPGSVKK
tara:strand:- start:20 stop:289 length:270 start_codon:yes stop_codon:yes gene_type:complete